MTFDLSSRNRLTRRALGLFTRQTLFDRLARAVCRAECLPRKELFEAWEVAKRVRRHFKGGRIVDLAAGHGLLAAMLLLLDARSPQAVCVDPRRPASADRLAEVLTQRWPQLDGRITYLERRLEAVEIGPDDVVVSVHACGRLTDRVLDRAVAGRARVAVLPCCHTFRHGDTGHLEGWMDKALAIDVARAVRLQNAGYRIRTKHIPEAITPKNRLLLGEPMD